MQLKSLRLGAMSLAGAVLLAAALPAPHAAAQAADDPAISSEREAERLRIQRAILDLVPRAGEARERQVRSLRSRREFSAARDTLESRLAWIEGIESGDPRVMYEMALRLRDGDGLPQHSEAAVTWLERAGDHGVPEGLHAAARMLLDDPDLPGGRSMGRILLKRAARKNVAAAQEDLGIRLIGGRTSLGIPDYNNGYAWLLLAQANGADVDTGALAEARDHLSEENRQVAETTVRRAIGRDLSFTWPLFDEDEAEEWWEQVAIALRWDECGRALSIVNGARGGGVAAADHRLGELHEEGTCVDQDATKAFDHYDSAFRAGHLESAFRLGLLYYDGRGVSQDLEAARRWFKAAALTLVSFYSEPDERLSGASRRMPRDPSLHRELPPELIAEIDWLAEIEEGDPQVLHETALRVRDGTGLPRDREAAERWLVKAGRRGVAEAYYDLGLTRLDDPVRPRDEEFGIIALAAAGRDGFVSAQVELGRRYAAGNQVQKWDHAAYVWLLMAEENGAEVAALLRKVGGRLSEEDRQTARADARNGTYYPLDSR